MQAIILAAGTGTRLKPLTDNMPKSLTEVNGVPLLINALDILVDYNVKETIIVVGYLEDKIKEKIGERYKEMKITYITNEIYRETNNIYSLFITQPYIREDVLLLECDLFFESGLIKELVECESECAIMVSPFNENTMDGSIITLSNGKISSLLTKSKQCKETDYSNAKKTVNIYKFSKNFMLEKFFPLMEVYINNFSMNSYYELILGIIIYLSNDGIDLIEVDESEWAEIDTVEDLVKAEEKFN